MSYTAFSYSRYLKRKHNHNPGSRRWLVIFALWVALIIPLFAYGVSASQAGKPVLRVASEQVASADVNFVSYQNTFAVDNAVTAAPNTTLNAAPQMPSDPGTLEHAALLHPDKTTRVEATAALNRTRQAWSRTLGIEMNEWNAVATARATSKVVIAVLRDLYVSYDGGQTFEQKQNVLPSMVNSLAAHPTNDRVLYAGVDGLGFYASQDGGDTWHASNTGIQVMPGARFGITAIEIDEQAPDTMYIAAGVWLGTNQITYHPLGILKTTDGGQTWTRFETETVEPVQYLMLDGNTLHTWSGGQHSSYAMQ